MNTTIEVLLNKKSDFYSKYSKDRISNELLDFIYNETIGENIKNRITINITVKEKISDEEKHKMMDTIRRTFGLRVQDELYILEKDKNKKTILLLIGIALIILYYSSLIRMLRELILILGWLIIWESIYELIFRTSNDYLKVERLKALAKARVYFYDSLSSKQESKS